jgi:uncharacterized protein
MSQAVFDGAIRIAEEAAATNGRQQISLVLHGGEPTLLPVAVFRRYVDQARSCLGDRLKSISLQTNGTRLSEAWLDALSETSVEVGISIDGPPEIHNAARRDHAGRCTWHEVVASIMRMQARGMDLATTLTVITPGADGLAVFEHLLSLGVRRMNFLLPDVSHDEFSTWYGHLGPTPVADFLIPIFDAWFELDDPSLHVAICWEIVERLLGGPGLSDMFGNPRLKYLVIETDGTIEALDALKVGAEGLADTGLNVQTNHLMDICQENNLAARAVTIGFNLAAECLACQYSTSCGGGYLPHRYASHSGFDNPSVWCRDLKKVFGHISQAIGLCEGRS